VPMRLALDRSSAAQQTYQGELAVVTHACRKLTLFLRASLEVAPVYRFNVSVSKKIQRSSLSDKSIQPLVFGGFASRVTNASLCTSK